MSSDFLADLKGTVSDVADTVKTGFNAVDSKASDLKKSFGRALVDATNLQPADMRKQQWAKDQQADLREYAAEASDMLLPGTTDALPVGKIFKGAKTAANIVNKIKKAESVNLPEITRKGAHLLEEVVKKAPTEKAIVRNIPSAADLSLELAESKMKRKAAQTVQEKLVQKAIAADSAGVDKLKNINAAIGEASKYNFEPLDTMDLKKKLVNAIYKKSARP